MPTPAWPETLQQLVDGESFDYKIGKTVLKSDMDTGLPKRRRRFTRPVNMATVSFIMNQSQVDDFLFFYNTTTNAGTTRFSFDHPITGEYAEWLFDGEPSLKHMGGGQFRASMVWEEMP